MAFDVVLLLSRLARDNRKTVICTIHQPSTKIFKTFDNVVLLACGHLVYAGSNPEVHFAVDLPQGENAAEVFMDWLQDDEKVDELIAAWAALPYGNDDFSSSFAPTTPKKVTTRRLGCQQSLSRLIRQTSCLAQRDLHDKLVDPEKFTATLCVKTLVGVIIGLVWIGQAKNTQESIFPVTGALFIVIINSMMDTVMITALSLANSRNLLLREIRNGFYTLLPRHIAVLFIDCLLACLAMLSQAFPVVFLVGLRSDLTHFLRFLVFGFILAAQGM